jgi:hypothetical protein
MPANKNAIAGMARSYKSMLAAGWVSSFTA